MAEVASAYGVHVLAGLGCGIVASFLLPLYVINVLGIVSSCIGILLWGRKVQAVTAEFGKIAASLLIFAWITSLLTIIQASNQRTMSSALLPAISLSATTLFIGRLASLHYEDRQWLIRLKKSDGQRSKKMPAFSSADFAKMESSV